MRTIILKIAVSAVFALMSASIGINAQGLYRPGQLITGTGFKYVCEIPWGEEGLTVFAYPGDIQLRNINAQFVGKPQMIGSKLVSPVDPPKTYVSKDRAYEKFEVIINSVFTAAEKLRTRGAMLIVELHVNSSTGKIADVIFGMTDSDGFATIPAEKYYLIETMLKQQITYQINAVGKQYNFNYDWWWYKGDEFK